MFKTTLRYIMCVRNSFLLYQQTYLNFGINLFAVYMCLLNFILVCFALVVILMLRYNRARSHINRSVDTPVQLCMLSLQIWYEFSCARKASPLVIGFRQQQDHICCLCCPCTLAGGPSDINLS